MSNARPIDRTYNSYCVCRAKKELIGRSLVATAAVIMTTPGKHTIKSCLSKGFRMGFKQANIVFLFLCYFLRRFLLVSTKDLATSSNTSYLPSSCLFVISPNRPYTKDPFIYESHPDCHRDKWDLDFRNLLPLRAAAASAFQGMWNSPYSLKPLLSFQAKPFVSLAG